MPLQIPTPIFHITAIPNLRSIAQRGELLSKAQVTAAGLQVADIAYQSVQGHRAIRPVQVGPGGNLHDYVPFYFAPRSPMLYTINRGNVAGCAYWQDDIVHLVSTAQFARDHGLGFVFTDLHAVKEFASFFDDLGELGQVDWGLIHEEPRLDGYCRYWNSTLGSQKYALRQEKRMAEFLVHHRFPLAGVLEIGVRNENMRGRVLQELDGSGWQPNVVCHPGWYY